jgi:hypothetical protein
VPSRTKRSIDLEPDLKRTYIACLNGSWKCRLAQSDFKHERNPRRLVTHSLDPHRHLRCADGFDGSKLERLEQPSPRTGVSNREDQAVGKDVGDVIKSTTHNVVITWQVLESDFGGLQRRVPKRRCGDRHRGEGDKQRNNSSELGDRHARGP